MKKGFTLIELLIAIAVIGILVSVIMFFGDKQKTNEKKSDDEFCQDYKFFKIENQPAICLKFYLDEAKNLK